MSLDSPLTNVEEKCKLHIWTELVRYYPTVAGPQDPRVADVLGFMQRQRLNPLEFFFVEERVYNQYDFKVDTRLVWRRRGT